MTLGRAQWKEDWVLVEISVLGNAPQHMAQEIWERGGESVRTRGLEHLECDSDFYMWQGSCPPEILTFA